MLESKLQRKIRKHLEATVGGFWRKLHGNMFQKDLPDLMGCVRSLAFHIEVKTDSKLSSGQISVLKQLRLEGACAFTTRSIEYSLKRVVRHLLKHGKITQEQASQISKKSKHILMAKKKGRTVHGTGNWKDHHNFKRYRTSTQKEEDK